MAFFKGVDGVERQRIVSSTSEEQEYVSEQLREFNLLHIPVKKKPKNIGFHMKDEDGHIMAGINGVLYWGHTCVYIEILWVDKRYRGQDIGSKLLAHIEHEAKESGAHLSHLETMDFQAKDFYVKQGYECFGVLDDCPEGHERYYLKKKI